MQINGETKIYTIIGYPVEHTVSPLMHNSAFNVAGINAIYVAFRVHPEKLSQAVDGMRSLGVEGFNVTLPHKVAIVPLLDEVDPSARRIGAVNTIKNDGGRLIGYNTDGEGALMALKTANVRLDGRVLILGAGGAARAIASTLVDHVNEIVIYNRTESRALELSSTLIRRSRFPIFGKKLDYRLSSEKITDGDIIINTTSVGMYPDVNNSPIDPNIINGKVTVFDVIYNPYKTKLLKQAETKGAKIVLGINMLVYQAMKSFEIWTDRTVDADVFLKAATSALGRH